MYWSKLQPPSERWVGEYSQDSHSLILAKKCQAFINWFKPVQGGIGANCKADGLPRKCYYNQAGKESDYPSLFAVSDWTVGAY